MKVIPDIDKSVTLYTEKGTVSPHCLQRPSRRYRLPATPTILAFRTITDWSQFAQWPTCDVLVDGSNAQGLVVREGAVGSMSYLNTP
jgi:hypothetical protein